MFKNIENFIDSLEFDTSNSNYYIIYKSIIDEFYSDKDSSIQKINFVFYDKFNIDPKNFNETSKLCEQRIGQTKFRADIINFYNCCIISGDDADICQACHIIPYSDSKFNHLNNGLLLNYNLHHLFDSNLIFFKFLNSFDDKYDQYILIISDKILCKNTYKNYHAYHNQIVKINKNSKVFFDTKYAM